MFKRRYPRCGKSFSDKSNYRRQERNERLPGHQKKEVLLRPKRKAVMPFFDNILDF